MDTTLAPIAAVYNRKEFEQLLQSDALWEIRMLEKNILLSERADSFTFEGFCLPCNRQAAFLVDMQWGGQRQDNIRIPNWRERLECPHCQMNNRKRLMATLVKQFLQTKNGCHVYLMEQVTPLYRWAASAFPKHRILGSEYLGYQYEGGAAIEGIQHENIEQLSFADASFDLLVSADVFEHVPEPAKAFAECARVLRPGGIMLATFPFFTAADLSFTRARLQNGLLQHILPPDYHGNPLSAQGSLVFTDFGWDVLDVITSAGFDVSLEAYASEVFAHLGGPLLVFRLVRK